MFLSRTRTFFRAAALCAAIAGLSGCAEVVEPGHRGVETDMGEVNPKVLGEGLHWYAPWQDIVVMDVREIRWDFKTLAYTKDLQEATLTGAVRYALYPPCVPNVLQKFGENWAETIVGPDVFDRMKGVIGQYTAENLVDQRDNAVAKIRVAVAEQLKPNCVEVRGVALTDIKYSDEYDNAVEQKAVAAQEGQAEINRTVKVREKGEQRKIDAEADALAMRSRADAIRANQSLLEWERLQVQRAAIEKWNGGVPLYQFGSSSNGPIPLIELPAAQPARPAGTVER